MKKTLTITLLVVVVLALLGGGIFYVKYASIHIGSDVTMASYIKDTVLEITKGTDVSVKHGENGIYQKITGKTVLKEDDYIIVGKDSEAVITWMDDSVTRLNSGSTIHITQLTVDSNDPTNTGISFDIFNGEVWSKAVNIVNDKSTFSMKSGKNSNVIAGLRGTTLDFMVDASGTHIRAIRHAIYLVGFDVNLAQGEEATITEETGNGNMNGVENSNTNSIMKGDLLINVNNIPSSLYTSTWFVQNFDGDKKHDEEMKQALLDRIQQQLSGVNDPLREWKLSQAIDGEKDGKEKVRLLVQDATEKLQMAVVALSHGDKAKGQDLWDDFEQRINHIKAILGTMEDQAFVTEILQKITANCNLWLKYSYLLLPDDTDMTNAMEQLILGLTTDPEQQAKLQTLFDARNFFTMTDQMDNSTNKEDVERMLQRYKTLLDKMHVGHIQDYECKILLQLRDKLKLYVLDLPPVFECRAQGGGGGIDVVCPDNQVRCPSGACVEKLTDCSQACPENKVKCPDGSCVEVVSDCPVSCPEGKVVCPDKTCASDLRSCPRLCGPNQVKCPNGSCANTLRECIINTNKNSPLNTNANRVVQPVCGNQICEKNLGETSASCPKDCSPVPVCGNNICEQGESTASCPKDCPLKPVCGNGVCEQGETHLMCPSDCPPPVVSGEVPVQ
jgi:uncharacterized protein YpmB